MKRIFLKFNEQFGTECRAILRLLGPILIAQFTIAGMNFTDTIMAGQVSPTDLAAVAVAGSFLNPVILLIQGILMAVTPLVAYRVGAQKTDDIASFIQQALYLALSFAVIGWVLLLSLSDVAFNYIDNIDASLRGLTNDYLFYVTFGLPAFACYQVLRGLNEAFANTKAIMLIGIAGLLINIPTNYIFINGLFGMPALGAAGCGVATATAYWLMFVLMVYYCVKGKTFNSLTLFKQLHKFDKTAIKRILQVGLPIGGAIFFEVTLFALVALLLAPLGPDVVAAHQVALNFTSMVFMIPLSIAIALTIRVGHNLGSGHFSLAKTSVNAGLLMALGIGCLTALFTILFRHDVITWYTDDVNVASIAAPLFLLAATYQVSDALQVSCGGALRGYQDTRYVFLVTLVSFWPIGLGIGSILAFTDWLSSAPLGAAGFWWAMVFALTTCAAGLLVRLIWATNNPEKMRAVNSNH